MIQAFAYLRVSGLSQVDGMGFDRQQTAIEKFAAANGYEIKQVFREEAITGKSELDGRPALQEVITAVLSNGVRVILIERLDRLARALIVQETILQDLTRKGITMISVSEPDLCTDDPTRTMIRQILGSFFEYERKMIVAKLSDARKRTKVKTGRCEGQKPFGFFPGEKDILEYIIRKHKSGHKMGTIAYLLNLSQLGTRNGKPWQAATVAKIVKRVSRNPELAHVSEPRQ